MCISVFFPAQKSKSNNNRKRRQQRPRKARRSNRALTRLRPNRRSNLGIPNSTYLKMVSDPCNCPLLPGIYGTTDGMLSKTKKTFYDGSNSTCGFVLWSPDWTNASSQDFGNLFTWVGLVPNLLVLNNTTHPFGRGARFDTTALTSHTESDPAFQFAQEGLVEDLRNISSCIDITYFGAMFEAEGELTYINDLPLTSLIDAANPVSVDLLFQWSNNTQRIGVDTHENVWRPTEDDTFFSSRVPSIVLGQVGTSVSNISDTAAAHTPTVFGFAYRGLDQNKANKLRYNLTKIIEWRPRASSGLAQTTVKTTGINVMQKVVKTLDTNVPGWQHTVKEAAAGLATAVSKAALTGVINTLKGPRRHMELR
jgi:hypothetical protein